MSRMRQWKAADYEEAERLMKRSILADVLAEIRGEILEEWRGAETPAQRESLHAEDKALTRIEGYLRGMVSELEYAREQRD